MPRLVAGATALLVAFLYFLRDGSGDSGERAGALNRRLVAGADALVKRGVILSGLDSRMSVPVAAARKAGLLPVVTSAVRPGDRGSLHHVGRAIDFRTRHLEAQEKEAVAGAVADALGASWDVVLESSPPHLHVEYDPDA